MFLNKYDIEKDLLSRRFDYVSKTYYYVKLKNGQNIVINYDQLNRKSQKRLLIENRELISNPDKLSKENDGYKAKERFDYLKSLGYDCNSFEYLGQANGTVSENLDNYLNELLSEDNVLIGIHRVGNNFSLESMNDIFSNGLIISGHMGGAVNVSKQLNNNVSYYSNNKTIKKELMYANNYKNSVGSILIRIPDDKLEEKTDILLFDGNLVRLNPKYIIGYVPVDDNHHIENIIFNNYSYDIDNSISKHI